MRRPTTRAAFYRELSTELLATRLAGAREEYARLLSTNPERKFLRRTIDAIAAELLRRAKGGR